MKNYLAPTLLLFLLTAMSCVKTIEIDLPEHDPKAVVNCLFQTDSLFSLELKRSHSIFDTIPLPLTNATVELFNGGQIIDTFYYDEGRYHSHIFPQRNTNYHIEVAMSEGEKVTSDSYIPNTPILEFLSLKDSIYTDNEGDFISQMNIVVSDTSYSDNYYELKLLYKFINYQNDTVVSSVYYDLINDPVLENVGLLNYYPDYLIFSDALFNGEDYQMTINFRQGSNAESYGLIIILRAVTKEYYEYRKTLTLHIEGKAGDIWNGVGEPLQMVSNINNGYGIFAGYSETIKEVNQ